MFILFGENGIGIRAISVTAFAAHPRIALILYSLCLQDIQEFALTLCQLLALIQACPWLSIYHHGDAL